MTDCKKINTCSVLRDPRDHEWGVEEYLLFALRNACDNCREINYTDNKESAYHESTIPAIPRGR